MDDLQLCLGRRAALGVVLGVLALPTLVSADVFLPGTQPGDIVDWPLRDNLVCAICHAFPFNPGDNRIEPWETWTGSMMANAARDPLFWAAVDIANQDAPGVGIGEFCLRCHTPRPWLEGRSSAPDGTDLVGTMGTPGGDYEGIDCEFCHRLDPGPESYLQNGQYWVTDPPAGGIPPAMRGPYDDANSPGHPTEFSEYHASSELCATCHDLRNPLVNLLDENGNDTGRLFPEQISYTEWLNSDFATEGTTCQDCHMPSGAGFVCTDTYPFRDHVPVHTFQGANAWMTTVLRGLYGESLSRTERYDRAINASLDMLQNETAELGLRVPWAMEAGAAAEVEVRVTNRTGHKLPTGYPEGRRMWLSVTAIDGEGATVWESGAYDPDTAELIADPDLKVYETIHGTHAGGAGFHLVLNDRIFKDNRIPPRGFVPDGDTQPVGYTYPPLPDGTLPHWDDTVYSVPIPAGTPTPVTVTASLWYQTTSREYVEFLRDENVTGPDPTDPDPTAPSRGEKMYAYWEQFDKCPPVLVATQTRRIRLDRSPPTVEPSPEPFQPRIASRSGNPFRGSATIEYDVPTTGATTLSVYDVTGRRVATLARGTIERGTHTAVWDGRSDPGIGAVAGTYWIRLETAGHAPVVKRVTRLR